MKEGTVKTSTLLIPKLKTLRGFGESVTDADVDNFDELVDAGFIDPALDEDAKKAKLKAELKAKKEADAAEKAKLEAEKIEADKKAELEAKALAELEADEKAEAEKKK